MKTYFGFAISDSMFPSEANAVKTEISVEQIRNLANAGELTPCLNPSHKATIDVMESRFDIHVNIPERAPMVSLNVGDRVIVMGVRGLPRKEGRAEYTPNEIEGAKFSFSIWTRIA